MPVIDSVFIARTPLVGAEQPVRWTAINRHVLVQRAALERTTLPIAKRLGYLIGAGLFTTRIRAELEASLASGLMKTYRFGHDEARHEIASLRAQNTALAAERSDVRPGAARRRFERLAAAAASDVETAAGKAPAVSLGPEIDASSAAGKALHNVVLESVGRALNYGRTEGALTAPGGPPTFSMRSEQLDRNCCERCVELHGEIVEVSAAEFFALMPPSDCLGGGRCRGVMVFADGVAEV